MKDLDLTVADLIALIDRHQAKFNNATAAENESSNADESEDQNCSAQIDTRTKADPALLEIIDKALAETSDTSDNTETQSDDSLETRIDSDSESETKKRINERGAKEIADIRGDNCTAELLARVWIQFVFTNFAPRI